jgi:DNA helicase-2/ATP-dependent DNA helicase PcrA
MVMMRMNLNTEQKQAITHVKGPLLIIAGAGTGKTTVITERIKRLISQGVSPSSILALTFTEKAAREMQERIDVALPLGVTDIWVTTFHAFCDRILRNEGIHIGISPSYKLFTQADSVLFFKNSLFSYPMNYFRPLGNPNKFIQSLLTHFSRLKDEDIDSKRYKNWVSKLQNKNKHEKEELSQWIELSTLYELYETQKRKENIMEFSDLVSETLHLFRKRPHVLKRYQQQFNHILVDEFQDTNVAQYRLLSLLVGSKNISSITVVGDDSQSIYKFRGAAVSNILSFIKDYPKAKRIVLTKNYRSTQEILDSAYRLIRHNDPDTLEVQLKISKNLKAIRRQGFEPELLLNNHVSEESEAVVNKITELHAEGYNWKDFALLTRANSHLEPIIRILKRKGIPYQFSGPALLFSQKEVRNLISYLRLLKDLTDSVSMYRVLTNQIFSIHPRDILMILSFSKKYSLSLFEACEIVVGSISTDSSKTYYLPFITKDTKDKITVLITMIYRHIALLDKDTAGQILFYFLEDTGLLKKMASAETETEDRFVKNITELFNQLKSFENEQDNASVSAFITWIDLAIEVGESPLISSEDKTEDDAVHLMTVHASKGLEFPVVFLINTVMGRFPTYERKEQLPIPEDFIQEILPIGDYHLEEERRLFYVGVTRARNRLFISASKYYGEGKRSRKLSVFTEELFGKTEKELSRINKNILDSEAQLSLLDYFSVKNTDEEEIVRMKKRMVNYLSYSQLDTFLLCPLKHKYQYELRLPTAPSPALSFGKTIHEVLRSLYQLKIQKETVNRKTTNQLLDIYWESAGYQSKKHEALAKKGAKDMLAQFYNNEYKRNTSETKATEQRFSFNLTPDCKMLGVFDRIDEKGDKLEIIDYKTGKMPSEKSLEKSLQMTVYALGATEKGIYNRRPEDILLTFYYLKEGKKYTSKRTAEMLKKAKQTLVMYKQDMETSKQEPTPGKHCDFCEFKNICPAWEE